MDARKAYGMIPPRLSYLGAAMVLVLILTGCAKSWKDYQRVFQQRLSQGVSGSEPSVLSGIEVGKIRTIQNDKLGTSDNCSTCHLGVTNALMTRADQPLARHRGKYLDVHTVEEYGCTVCHAGNGQGLEEKQAHAGMRRGMLVQISCARCHWQALSSGDELAGAPALSSGMRLLKDLSCTSCHRIDGLASPMGVVPVLTGVGSKVNYRWLARLLKNPQLYMTNATMPMYHIADEYIEALSAYLMTFTDSTIARMNEPPPGDSEHGGNLLREVRCISCHPFNGTGGHLAPDIGKIGNKVSRRWLFQMLQQPKRFQPETTMPQFNFSLTDYSNLVEYLFEEYTDYETKAEDEDDTRSIKNDPQTVDLGRRIFKELRCGNCHRYEGEKEWLQLGPVLTNVGEKRIEEIDLGDSPIERSLPEYLFMKVKQPQAFATESNLLKMPDYHLSDEQARDITIALLSLNSDRVKSKEYMVRRSAVPPYEPSGEFGDLLEKYQCYSCHTINGRGYNLAYDLSIEGSRVKRKWLYDYLMMSYSIRPILVERMPVFRFSPHEATVLTDGIMTQLVSADIPGNLEREFTIEMVRLGEKLFDEKGCITCHIVGEKGGYIGPSFTIGANVGDKLQGGWLYRWLKNPQAIVSDVLEPNYNLSDSEAQALTAYVMSINSRRK